MHVITAKDAAKLIADGSTVGIGGMGLSGWPEEIARAIEASFLETGHPRSLKLRQGSFIGDGSERGVVRFAHKGLITSWTVGIVGLSLPLTKLVEQGEIECHCLPQGVIINLWREIAAGRPGLITKVGIGTFVDPLQEGGWMGGPRTEEPVESIEIHGERYLFYKSFPVQVALIRGTYADEDGNISFERESVMNEGFALAAAAKASGGIVIAQVEKIVSRGSIQPREVRVPSILVDYVVEASDDLYSWQTEGTRYNEAFCTRTNAENVELPRPQLNARKVIARRASMELHQGDVVNLGIGIPASIALVCAEEEIAGSVVFTSEAGCIGGTLAPLPDFGSTYYPEALIDAGSMFDLIDGGVIDATFLGMAQVDAEGNVNVSKFGGRINGPGGLINLASSCKRVVFCGTFSTRARMNIGDGKLTVEEEGANKKFVRKIDQITFSGAEAAARGSNVLYVTERAVFKLTENGLELIEIAPGIDLQKDVLDQMEFMPIVSDGVTYMQEEIFGEIWGASPLACE